MYSFYQNGSLRKRKATPENANYQVILPIRAMLLKKQDLKKYKAKTQVVKESVIPMVQQYKIQVCNCNKLSFFPIKIFKQISGLERDM